MKQIQSKFIFVVLVLLVIILGSVLSARIQQDDSSRLPYVVGSPVVPSTEMPAGMVMKTFTVPSDEIAPTINFDITKDTMGGWDVHVATTNFMFSPDHLDGPPVAGEGHVHLYIDNSLMIMLGPWYHIDSLTPGPHEVRVGLFNNDHSAYSINGQHIEAMKQIIVSDSKTMMGM